MSLTDMVAGESYDIYLGGTAEGEEDSGLYVSEACMPGTLVATVTAG